MKTATRTPALTKNQYTMRLAHALTQYDTALDMGDALRIAHAGGYDEERDVTYTDRVCRNTGRVEITDHNGASEAPYYQRGIFGFRYAL